MNYLKRNLTLFICLMLPCPAVMILLFSKVQLVPDHIGNYSDEQLMIYSEIRQSLSLSFETQKRDLLICMLMIWALIFIFGLLLFTGIYLKQIRPIREMEALASQIAKGNLDTPLPMQKDSVFERFTESFDLMREELKTSKEKERRAQNSKRELVAGLSHDLKTPVASIKATCEVLDLKYRKKLKDAEANGTDTSEILSVLEKLDIISAKAETINRLAQNVFSAALDETDEIAVNVIETSSADIEGYFTNLKDYGNIILENHIPECLVRMDPLRMEQVADNIVGNSYKYAGTDILVSFDEISPSEKDGHRFIRITIRDKGPGVPDAELALLTEKYYRGSNSADRSGYGLGLYLVNWYMEKQGGGMEYYNDNGFVVELLVPKV